MTLKSALSLFAATVKHQLRCTAMTVLALTCLDAGALKAQNCPANYYALYPATTLPGNFSHNGGPGWVYVYTALPSCTWTLIKEPYSGNFLGNFQFAGGAQTVSGRGSGYVYYNMAANLTYGMVQGNVHIQNYGNRAAARAQVVERAYPN
jgi:hypothetical protein